MIDVWPSAGLLNAPFIFTMASLISESLQICYFPFPPQANGASKPHGTPRRFPPPVARRGAYLPSHPGKPTWPQLGGTAASGGVFQADHVQTSFFTLRLQSEVSCRRKAEETFTKSFGYFSWMQCIKQCCTQPSSVLLIPAPFAEQIFEGRELIRDAAGCPVPA